MEGYLIRKIEKKDIEGTAKVYMEAFNFADAAENWTVDTAVLLVKYWIKRKGDLFFVAVINGEIAGGIVGDTRPFCGKNQLVDVELFVSPQHHKKGIAKKLVKTILEEAIKNYSITEMNGIANFEVKFPMEWYERLGFGRTKWVFIEGKAEEILKNLTKNEKH